MTCDRDLHCWHQILGVQQGQIGNYLLTNRALQKLYVDLNRIENNFRLTSHGSFPANISPREKYVTYLTTKILLNGIFDSSLWNINRPNKINNNKVFCLFFHAKLYYFQAALRNFTSPILAYNKHGGSCLACFRES